MCGPVGQPRHWALPSTTIGKEVTAMSDWHPDWCVREFCTAYQDTDNPVHRTAPTVLPTQDAGVAFYIHYAADTDGSDPFVEIAKLHQPDVEAGSWHTASPRIGIALPLPLARQFGAAIGAVAAV
jgi:hypothetical protein